MASKTNSRRWILLGLVVLGVVVAATLPRSGTDEAEQETAPAEASGAEQSPATWPAAHRDVDSGLATRRIKENCDPVAEALKYEEFVDRRALAILSWNNMSERAAKLQIPVYVKSTANGAIGVSILEVPMREQYLGIWTMSGHLKKDPESGYSLDPCSAKIVAWEAMDRLHPPADDDDDEATEP
jgi:hypothetical protein